MTRYDKLAQVAITLEEKKTPLLNFRRKKYTITTLVTLKLRRSGHFVLQNPRIPFQLKACLRGQMMVLLEQKQKQYVACHETRGRHVSLNTESLVSKDSGPYTRAAS